MPRHSAAAGRVCNSFRILVGTPPSLACVSAAIRAVRAGVTLMSGGRVVFWSECDPNSLADRIVQTIVIRASEAMPKTATMFQLSGVPNIANASSETGRPT
jgi:hypothetical protein